MKLKIFKGKDKNKSDKKIENLLQINKELELERNELSNMLNKLQLEINYKMTLKERIYENYNKQLNIYADLGLSNISLDDIYEMNNKKTFSRI